MRKWGLFSLATDEWSVPTSLKWESSPSFVSTLHLSILDWYFFIKMELINVLALHCTLRANYIVTI